MMRDVKKSEELQPGKEEICNRINPDYKPNFEFLYTTYSGWSEDHRLLAMEMIMITLASS